jgi:integrase
LYRTYLRSRPKGNHPFLFVSEHPAHRGEPYTIEAFEQAHARAVRRIGLVPGKLNGTSPHGHRHAYGLALRRAGVDPIFIQRAMHHRSPHSQAVYTGPSTAEVSAALRQATPRLLAVPTFEENGDETN